MSEANFSFTTKVGGDLFTIRGNTLDEFTLNLGGVLESVQGLIGDLKLLQAAGNAAPLVATPQPVQPAPVPVPQPVAAQPEFPSNAQPAQPQAAGHVCQCGLPMRLRNSQYGSFYSCPKPMSDQSRCNLKVNV